jgi:hypothetical protein
VIDLLPLPSTLMVLPGSLFVKHILLPFIARAVNKPKEFSLLK